MLTADTGSLRPVLNASSSLPTSKCGAVPSLFPIIFFCVWAVPSPVLFNDVWRFDPASKFWTNISVNSQGSAPSERYGMGLTSGNGKLYVYGGNTREHLFAWVVWCFDMFADYGQNS